jgi:hypothetical protein
MKTRTKCIIWLENHPDFKPGWYFKTEDEGLIGPYSRFEKAEHAFNLYVKEL